MYLVLVRIFLSERPLPGVMGAPSAADVHVGIGDEIRWSDALLDTPQVYLPTYIYPSRKILPE